MHWSRDFYRSQLIPKQQMLYDSLLKGWCSGQTTVTLPGMIKDTALFEKIISYIILDHPEVFWVNYYTFDLWTNLAITRLTIPFYCTSGKKKQFQQQLDSWSQNIAQQIPAFFSVSDRLWLIFDYLARQVTYGGPIQCYRQTVLGPMKPHVHKSVCEGIAKSFKLLCDQAGLDCIVVFGSADFGEDNRGLHAWNIVSCNGVYRHVDITSELTNAKAVGMASYDNFLHKDNEMTAYTWDQDMLPRCI